MQSSPSLFERFQAHVMGVLTEPFDPNERLFALYLASSLIFAFGIYLAAERKGVLKEKTFLQFLFPRHVWQHPSAWLDLRYFFFHKFIGHFLVVILGTGLSVTVYQWLTGQEEVILNAIRDPIPKTDEIFAIVSFLIVATIVVDFVSFFSHYLQHKIPVLWQFHKVHHSAEVMHPVSNFREHPVDNLLYMLAHSLTSGLLMAGATTVFGFVPSAPAILGVSIVGLLFNVSGYHLRHSHIWLRWPGKLSMIFPSPAHHHVHHSCHPDHIDKNFAFMFPVWDVIFKTYHMPEDNRDVKFGIGSENEGELTSCLRLYYIPFRDTYRLLRRTKDGSKSSSEAQPQVTPAE
ncbi:MAG: sterol desaturase family protein [Pseudomonadota bacterium]